MFRESDFSVLKWITSNSGKYLWWVILLSFNSMLISLCFILIALLSKQILDLATGDRSGSIVLMSLYLIMVILFQALCNIVSSNCKIRAQVKIENRLKENMLLKLLSKQYEEILEFHTGELMNRFTSDIEFVVAGLISFIPQVISLFTKIIAGLGVLFYMDKNLTLGILLAGLLVIVLGRIYSLKFRYLHKQIQHTGGVVRSFMQECLDNVIVVKSYNNEDLIKEQLVLKQEQYFHAKVKQNTISNLASTGIYIIMSTGYYVTLSYGALQISKGVLTFGTLMAFLQILNQIKGPFRNVSGLLPQYESMIASAQRLREIENLKNEDRQHSNVIIDEFYEKFESIDFINCSFAYKDKVVFEKINIRIKQGAVMAIVGESGQGKTTLFHLLMGLYQVNSGDIYWRLKDKKIKLDASTRSLFAYVPQGNLILSGTIKDNIMFGNPRASETQLKEVIRISCLDSVLEKLKYGIETELKEHGSGLSQGQNQRIAIARALLSEAPILLLDECTSSLDAETEYRLLKNLREYHKKTVLCISHRQAAIMACDGIIKIEQGEITLSYNE